MDANRDLCGKEQLECDDNERGYLRWVDRFDRKEFQSVEKKGCSTIPVPRQVFYRFRSFCNNRQ
jgi:hypothetical protein